MNHRPCVPFTATALALAALAGAAAAGPLADPTRPPAALMAPGGLAAAALPHQANRDTARAIAAAQRAAEPPPPPPAPPAPVLVQSVQLPAHGAGAAVALVDGRLVRVGDALDGRAVLAIDGQGLLVKGPRGPERLWLLGGTPKLAAGSITQSQSARYQQAPADGPATASPTTAGAVPGTAPAARPGTAGLPANTSAAATPLSLATRTAP